MVLGDPSALTAGLAGDVGNPWKVDVPYGGAVSSKGGVIWGVAIETPVKKAVLGQHCQAVSGRSRRKLEVGGNGDMSHDRADLPVKFITHTINAVEYSFYYFHLPLGLGHLPLKLNMFSECDL